VVASIQAAPIESAIGRQCRTARDSSLRETQTMPGVESRDFSSPDETRTPDKTRVELVNLAGGQIGRYTFAPGWRWSECIKPVVNTPSCQVEHIGYVVSGSLHIKHDDGSEDDLTPGKVYRVAPGHDAWNPGQEPAVFVEFQGAANYARG
jgi:hypothetical protein